MGICQHGRNILRNNHKKLFLLYFLLVTGGCAGWSEERCQTTDWERLGEDDGDAGRTAEYVERYVEACAPHGVEPDRDAWTMGYLGGRDDYCTVAGGVTAGRAGRRYLGICEAGFEEDFLAGHEIGRRLYRIDEDIRALNQRLNQFELELNFNRSLTADRRQFYLREIVRIRRQITNAEAERDLIEKRAAELLRGPVPAATLSPSTDISRAKPE